MIKIICDCKQLVEVVERTISVHETRGDGILCSRSGKRYLPQRRSSNYEYSGPGPDPAGPPIQILDTFEVEHGDHSHQGVLVAVDHSRVGMPEEAPSFPSQKSAELN